VKAQKRPVFLDLTKIKFPPMAIASILHRASGVVLFLAIPFLLWALALSLRSAQSFYYLEYILSFAILKLIVWGIATMLFYHLAAGIRHLMMDAGYAEELRSGRISAYVVFVATIVFFILSGLWVW